MFCLIVSTDRRPDFTRRELLRRRLILIGWVKTMNTRALMTHGARAELTQINYILPIKTLWCATPGTHTHVNLLLTTFKEWEISKRHTKHLAVGKIALSYYINNLKGKLSSPTMACEDTGRMRVCVHVCVWDTVCMCVYETQYVCVCVWCSVCVYVCVWDTVCVCVCVWCSVCVCMIQRVCVCVFVRQCVWSSECVCVYQFHRRYASNRLRISTSLPSFCPAAPEQNKPGVLYVDTFQ